MSRSSVTPLDILIVGGGAREHTLAWAVHRSSLCAKLFVAPGNDSTPGERVDIAAHDVEALTAFAVERGIALVVIGPEVALAAGLADKIAAAGIAVFGPSRAAAQLEWSKSFTRQVASVLQLPSPAWAAFESHAELPAALSWWRTLGDKIVVKQAGLAGGKGVVVPLDDETCEATIRSFFTTGPVVLEQRLRGPECSLLAFCDGHTARPLPFAQDHKRLGEGDTGPNTGGMGAFAPAPVPYDLNALTAQFIQPVIDHMRANGTPFVGMLYAGLMLTADGPKLLEFNCRFGDPEAQVLIPLIESDIVEIMLACCNGQLANTPIEIRDASALGVVIAAPSYPTSGPTVANTPPSALPTHWPKLAPPPTTSPTPWRPPAADTAETSAGARMAQRCRHMPLQASTSTKAPVPSISSKTASRRHTPAQFLVASEPSVAPSISARSWV